MKIFLRLLFVLIYCYNCFYVFIIQSKNGNSELNNNESLINMNKSKLDKLNEFIVFIIFLLGLIIAVFSNKISAIIVLVIFTIPNILRNLNNSLAASESIKNIVFGNGTDGELTSRDLCNFEIFVGGLVMVDIYVPFSKVIDFINVLTDSERLQFLLISTYQFVFVFCISFIFCVHLIIPLRHLKNGCEWVTKKAIKIYKKVDKVLFEGKDGRLLVCHLTNRLLAKCKGKSRWLKLELFIPALLLFIVDVALNIFVMGYIYLVSGLLGTLTGFIRRIWYFIISFFKTITGIPGRKVMKNTFRISCIIAIAYVVITNRLSIYISFR